MPVISVAGPAQVLRRLRGRPGDRPRGQRGGDLRLPRPQRRRQDDHGRDPRGLPRAQRGRGRGAGPGPGRARRRAWRERIGHRAAGVPPDARADRARGCCSSTPATTPTPRGVEETIALVGLAEKADARTSTLSGGQQRRLDVAMALVGDPELLFLDEPTTGFDPSARRRAWEVIGGLRDLGKTVFLTTHYMDEAQALADRVAILAAGRIVAEGPPDELGDRDRARDADQLPPAAGRRGRRAAGRRSRRRRGSTGAEVSIQRRGPRPAAARADRLGRRARRWACRGSRCGGRASRTSTWS